MGPVTHATRRDPVNPLLKLESHRIGEGTGQWMRLPERVSSPDRILPVDRPQEGLGSPGVRRKRKGRVGRDRG